jgi:hypothetical protein
MKNWLELSKDRRRDIFMFVAEKEGLPTTAVEKDWWVTIALQIVFSLPAAEAIVFKGGTSLSKGWNLIERFSEDIDLAIDRNYLGFPGDLSATQVGKLRKAANSFLKGDFLEAIKKEINRLEIPNVELKIENSAQSDVDPIIIEMHYESVMENSEYLLPRVLIEVGARSLKEPWEKRGINSLIAKHFTMESFANPAFDIPIVLPKRTFLEKIFLLHEEFEKNSTEIRVDRLSRHLYDIERLMDTQHGKDALVDIQLFDSIVNHRKKFNVVRGIIYDNHHPHKLNFIPPEAILKEWEKDYVKMQENMIYGDTLSFPKLLNRLKELQERFRTISVT